MQQTLFIWMPYTSLERYSVPCNDLECLKMYHVFTDTRGTTRALNVLLVRVQWSCHQTLPNWWSRMSWGSEVIPCIMFLKALERLEEPSWSYVPKSFGTVHRTWKHHPSRTHVFIHGSLKWLLTYSQLSTTPFIFWLWIGSCTSKGVKSRSSSPVFTKRHNTIR